MAVKKADGTKIRLPKPLPTCTMEALTEYRDAALEGGDKRVLADEVIRLRKLLGAKAKPAKAEAISAQAVKAGK